MEAAEAVSTAEVAAAFMAVEDFTEAEAFTEEVSPVATLVAEDVPRGWVITAAALAVITVAEAITADAAFLADATGEAGAAEIGEAGVDAVGVGVVGAGDSVGVGRIGDGVIPTATTVMATARGLTAIPILTTTRMSIPIITARTTTVTTLRRRIPTRGHATRRRPIRSGQRDRGGPQRPAARKTRST